MLPLFGHSERSMNAITHQTIQCVCGLVSFFMLGPLTRCTISVTEKYGYRRISVLSLVFIMLLVVSATGIPGAVIAVTGAGIGLIPVLCGSRRMNCLGVILLPMACNLSGFGPSIASFLGLF